MTSPFPSVCSKNHTERSSWKCCYTYSTDEREMAQLFLQLSHGDIMTNALCI